MFPVSLAGRKGARPPPHPFVVRVGRGGGLNGRAVPGRSPDRLPPFYSPVALTGGATVAEHRRGTLEGRDGGRTFLIEGRLCVRKHPPFLVFPQGPARVREGWFFPRPGLLRKKGVCVLKQPAKNPRLVLHRGPPGGPTLPLPRLQKRERRRESWETGGLEHCSDTPTTGAPWPAY